MKIGILGSGAVGKTLATGFLRHGHDVMIGSREPHKLDDWKNDNPEGKTGVLAESAAHGDILVLAVKGLAASNALNEAGAENLKGKIVIDATNPIADEAPVNGVLPFFTDFKESLMEKTQREFPEASFVKAFNSVGAARMVNPDYDGIRPTMFICGKDEASKKAVEDILEQFGWETEDLGAVEAARAIEPLCILWCIPGLAFNQWSHAFKLLKS